MLNAAAKDRFVPRYRFADQSLLAAPWMPGINDFADLSIMGFVLSTCSILFGEVVVLQRNLWPRVNSSHPFCIPPAEAPDPRARRHSRHGDRGPGGGEFILPGDGLEPCSG